MESHGFLRVWSRFLAGFFPPLPGSSASHGGTARLSAIYSAYAWARTNWSRSRDWDRCKARPIRAPTLLARLRFAVLRTSAPSASRLEASALSLQISAQSWRNLGFAL